MNIDRRPIMEIARDLREGAISWGIYHTKGSILWHRYSLDFRRIVITPTEYQFQVMNLSMFLNRLIPLEYRPEGYRCWEDVRMDEMNLDSFGTIRLTDMLNPDLVDHMMDYCHHFMTVHTYKENDFRSGIWYVVQKSPDER